MYQCLRHFIYTCVLSIKTIRGKEINVYAIIANNVVVATVQKAQVGYVRFMYKKAGLKVNVRKACRLNIGMLLINVHANDCFIWPVS